MTELEQYKEFIDALFDAAKDIEIEHPIFTVALTREIKQEPSMGPFSTVPVKTYSFYFTNTEIKPFKITVDWENIKYKQNAENISCRKAIKKIVERELYKTYKEIVEKTLNRKE